MSKTTFQSNIKQISKNVNAYMRIAVKTSYACIVIHQHLGLVENIAQTAQFLLGSKVSIVIPDLFLSVTSKTLLNNEFDAIKKLKFSRVIEAVEACTKQLEKSHSKIMLMGFSIGSAYGFKVLEQFPNKFESAFLFYGTPSTKNWDPAAIRGKVISFYGTDDKIKYLSDYSTYQQFMKKCKNNPNIKFEQINGIGHGFANPESNNFSEKAVMYCQKIIFSHLPADLATHTDGGKIEDESKKDCAIF